MRGNGAAEVFREGGRKRCCRGSGIASVKENIC